MAMWTEGGSLIRGHTHKVVVRVRRCCRQDPHEGRGGCEESPALLPRGVIGVMRNATASKIGNWGDPKLLGEIQLTL
jgi:hypothetical protein